MARITFKEINDKMADKDMELVRKGKDKTLAWVRKSTGRVLFQYDNKYTLDYLGSVETWIGEGVQVYCDSIPDFPKKEEDDVYVENVKRDAESKDLRDAYQETYDAYVDRTEAVDAIEKARDGDTSWNHARPIIEFKDGDTFTLNTSWRSWRDYIDLFGGRLKVIKAIYEFIDGFWWRRGFSKSGRPLNHSVKL